MHFTTWSVRCPSIHHPRASLYQSSKDELANASYFYDLLRLSMTSSEDATIMLLQFLRIDTATVASDPLMSQDVIWCQSLAWVFAEELCHQVLGLLCDVWREGRTDIPDLFVCALFTAVFKWWLPHKELVEQDTESPDINT